MRRAGAVIGSVALATSLAGCWVQPGINAARSNWNPGETALATGTVGGLTQVWSAHVPSGSHVNSPVSMSGGIYVTTGSGQVAAVDAASGAVRWSRDFFDEQAQVAPSFSDPVWDQGALLVPASVYRFGGTFKLDLTDGSTISGGISDNNATAQIAVAGGQPAVRSGFITSSFLGITTISWKYRPGVLFQSSAPSVFAIVGDRIQWVWGSQALGFSAACPSYPPPYPSNIGCAPDWTTTLGGSATAPTGLGTDGVVYGDASGRVSVLDTATGAVRWATELGSPIGTAPAVTADSIFVATQDGRLVALDAANGAERWEANLGGTPGTSPVVGGDVAYVGLTGATGDLVAVAAHGCGAATCPTLKTVSAGSPVTGGPIVDDGRLNVGTQGGDVVAFGLVT